MILSIRARRRPDIRLTRTVTGDDPHRRAAAAGTLPDPDWAIREIVEAVAADPAR